MGERERWGRETIGGRERKRGWEREGEGRDGMGEVERESGRVKK